MMESVLLTIQAQTGNTFLKFKEKIRRPLQRPTNF